MNSKVGLRLSVVVIALSACTTKTEPGGPLPVAETNISGFVFDGRTGAPLVGARVFTVPATSEVTTGAGGIYQIKPIASGNYEVHADIDSYAENQVAVTVSEGEGTTADVGLFQDLPVLTLDSQTLDFETDGTEQRFMVSNTGAAGTMLEWSIAEPENYLTLSTNGGALASGESVEVVVTADRSVLAENYGRFASLISVVSNGGEVLVSVRLDFINPNLPHLSYTYQVFNFGLNDQRAELILENDGTGLLTWTSSTNLDWLGVNPPSGQIMGGQSQTLELLADRTVLIAGQEAAGFLAFESDSVIDDAVPLRIHIAQPHVYRWDVPTTPLDFGDFLIDRTVPLTNTGSDILAFNSRTNPQQPWVRIVPSNGVILPGNTLNAYVLVNRGQMPTGPFNSQVNFTSRVSTVAVDLSGLNVARPIFVFTRERDIGYTGEREMASNIFVTNQGSGSINWTVTTTTPWIRLTGAMSGTVDNDNCFVTPQGLQDCGNEVPFVVDRTLIPGPGNHVGSLRITNTDDGSSFPIPVRIGVRPYHWESMAAPPVESRFSPMVYDVLRDRMVMFGGLRSPDPNSVDETIATTWELNGDTWQVVNTATTPPAREGHQLIYDARRGRVVLVGGFSYPLRTPFEDTWEYDGTNWTRTVESGAPIAPGFNQHMQPRNVVFDPGRGQIVMYGAFESCSTVIGTAPDGVSMFAYDGAGWVDISPPNLPAMCDMLLVHWQGQLWLQGVEGQFRSITTTWTEVPGQGWRQQLTPLPVTHYVASPIVVRDRDQSLWEVSGGRLNFSVTEAHPVLITGYPGALPVEYDVTPLESFYYQFGRQNLQDGGLTNIPFTARRAHGGAYDSRRDRIVVAGGDCERGSRGRNATGTGGRFPWTQCTDAWSLVMQTNGMPPIENPAIQVSATNLAFGAVSQTEMLTITNSGTGTLDFAGVPPVGFTAMPDFGRIEAGQSVTVQVSVDRGQLPSGARVVPWSLRSDGGAATIDLSVTVP